MKLSYCIQCGCHDLAACHDPSSDGPCSWLAVDREQLRGVCSACPDALTRWRTGDRSFAEPAQPKRQASTAQTLIAGTADRPTPVIARRPKCM